MGMRRTASGAAVAAVFAAGLIVAGCDRCLDCRCTCDYQKPALETKVVTSKHGFDCGQTCEREENCGLGHVVASECVRASVVDGRLKGERCARADAPRSRD